MIKRGVCGILAVLMLIFALSACEGGKQMNNNNSTAVPGNAAPTTAAKATGAPVRTPDLSLTMATIEMESGDVIKAELFPEIAPITVANFQKLVQEGFYDGLTFHRVIKGFMIQGGDPLGNGTGGSSEKIKGEFIQNGVKNNLEHIRGVLSMARSSASMNSASSQFFIMHQDSPHLDGGYAAFGQVVEGMDAVDKIAESTPVVDANGTVLAENQPRIKKVTLGQAK